MKKRRYVETESVEEFLARGGEIQTEYKLPTEPLQVMGDYSNKEFEQKLHGFYNSKEWKIAKNKVKLMYQFLMFKMFRYRKVIWHENRKLEW